MYRPAVNRRVFATIVSVAFVDAVFTHRLLRAAPPRSAKRWLRMVHELCRDLRTDALDATQWDTAIRALHDKLPVDDLVALLDLDAVAKRFTYPERGVVTRDPVLPKLAGGYSFIGRIFGMAKGRAIIPHGHRNMVSAHRVIGGELHLRQYDRVRGDAAHLWLRPTVDEAAELGSTSAITPAANNVHWLIATTDRAFTFDVIVAGIGGDTGIDNLDIHRATKDGDLLRVPMLGVDAALAKYG